LSHILFVATVLFSQSSRVLGAVHSFPTRRSSDLGRSETRSHNRGSPPSGYLPGARRSARPSARRGSCGCPPSSRRRAGSPAERRDRKSTRLNSSHVSTSYAVFCLKKKKATSSSAH